jgi:tetratricopeptide (TPR) repeat protein
MAKPRSESDPQFEIAFYENVLKNSPNFVEALMAVGDLYTKEGFYQKGLAIDEKLAKLRPDSAVIFYNLACSYSLMNDVPKARAAMHRAFLLGYDDITHLDQDTDLLNLLGDAEFVAYLKQVRSELRQLASSSPGSGEKAEDSV